MTLSLIAAVARNRVIGAGGGLPWRLPDDLKRFQAITRGHAVVMGRRTFESLGKPLRDRRNIVVSSRAGYAPEGVEVVRSLDEALDLVGGEKEVFVMGGASLYREALPRADRLYLTRVDAAPDGDVSFPEWDPSEWRLVSEEPHAADARHPWAFRFEIYERV